MKPKPSIKTKYQNLVLALLNCPEGKEEEILNAHSTLVNETLTQYLLETAEYLRQQGSLAYAAPQSGSRQRRGRLLNVATRLLVVSASQPQGDHYMDFWLTIFRAVRKDPSPQSVYLLLKNNLDKLNDRLGEALEIWAYDTLTIASPENQDIIAAVIGNCSNLIQEFPLGNKADNLEIALKGYQAILIIYTKAKFPREWAQTKNNIAHLYYQRIKGNRRKNREAAIAAYQQALSILTKPLYPQDWAKIQVNLAHTYWERIEGDGAENLELALAAYEKALTVVKQEEYPSFWGEIQYHLGRTYSKRRRGDKADNLEMAIVAYRNSLRVFTCEEFGAHWAMVQANLAMAYDERIKGNKRKNMEQSIAAYEQALSVVTEDILSQDWANTKYNLGTAYRRRAEGDKAENIEKSWEDSFLGYDCAIQAVEQTYSNTTDDQRCQRILNKGIQIYRKMIQACIYNGNELENCRRLSLEDLMRQHDLDPDIE